MVRVKEEFRGGRRAIRSRGCSSRQAERRRAGARWTSSARRHMNSSPSSNRLTRLENRKHAARLGNALFHSSGKARDRPAPFSCIRASGRRRVSAAAALDHIVRRTTRAGPITADALARRCAPQSRAFRHGNERRVRSNVVDRRAGAPRTGSLHRGCGRLHERRGASVRASRCQI
jgi:hypothetical protein